MRFPPQHRLQPIWEGPKPRPVKNSPVADPSLPSPASRRAVDGLLSVQ